MRCKAIKKDGERCEEKAMIDGFCTRHYKIWRAGEAVKIKE